MFKICVFAGTTEGRRIVSFLAGQGVEVTACVATEYGKELINESANVTVSDKRMSCDEMEAMMKVKSFDLVVDATHPYAALVTENIQRACENSGTEYLRLLRDDSKVKEVLGKEKLISEETENSDSREKFADNFEEGKVVNTIEEAVEFLDSTEGNILLTTGSKDLHKFSAIKNFSERVYARVLPMEDSLKLCKEAGVKPAHIIGMQGPFSVDMNMAQLKAISAKWLVSKDGGSTGGFLEKVEASINTGVKLLIIGRPVQSKGKSYEETLKLLCHRFGLIVRPKVTIVGIGPGAEKYMTKGVSEAINEADCLIGAARMLESVGRQNQERFFAIAPDKIESCIRENSRFSNFCVVMSGDTGFFSGTKKLLPLLKDCEVEILSGISSPVYLCSKLGMSYEDIKMVSTHGRNHNIAADVKANRKVFALVGGESGICDLCSRLVEAGLEDVRVYVGERLSYKEEKITTGKAGELLNESFDSLSVALIVNESPNAVVTHGLPDEVFHRNLSEGEVVPMTKMEVRAVSISKLQLTAESICYDIGAGTGSVSLEMALMAKNGHVYAIERKEKAVELLKMNQSSMGIENMTIVAGAAPEAMEELPPPTHAFLGGTSGNAKKIITSLLAKNPKVRIVATAIALESIGELTALIKDYGFSETEIISMTVAKDRSVGSYHLMTGQNPIYIFTMQNK